MSDDLQKDLDERSREKEQKVGLFGKIRRQLVLPDAKSVLEYIVLDVAIPAVIDTAYNMVMSSVNMFFGRQGTRNASSGRKGYDQYFGTKNNMVYSNDPNYIMEDLTFDSYEKAMNALRRMRAWRDQYGSISVKKAYEIGGVPTDYTKDRWGWRSPRDLDEARVVAKGSDYIINIVSPTIL